MDATIGATMEGEAVAGDTQVSAGSIVPPPIPERDFSSREIAERFVQALNEGDAETAMKWRNQPRFKANQILSDMETILTSAILCNHLLDMVKWLVEVVGCGPTL